MYKICSIKNLINNIIGKKEKKLKIMIMALNI